MSSLNNFFRAFILCALCTLSSCSSLNDHPRAACKDLRIAMSHDPLSLDPRCVYLSRDIAICQLIYEGLIRASNDKLEFGLADNMSISDCKTRYIFHLKQTYWSNGDALTAYDFEQSIKDIFNKNIVSPAISLLLPIKNTLSILKKQAHIDSLGLRALDSHTLEFELEQPCEYFLELLASPIYFPVHASLRDECITKRTYSRISNGAVTIQKYHPQNQIVLQKNPLYYDQTFQPHFDRIKLLVVPDHYTAIQLFKNNQIDWIGAPWTSSLSQDERLYIHSDYIHVYPILATATLICNVQSGPLKNPFLRQAINLALDKEKLIPFVYPGKVAHYVTPPSISLLEAKRTSLEEQRQQAKELLRLAKKTIPEKELENLVIIYPLDSSNLKSVVQEIQKQLRDVLHLNFQIRGLEYQCFLGKRRNFEFSLATGKWIAEYNHPLSFLSIFSSSNTSLHPILAQWGNSEYDTLVHELSLMHDKERNQMQAEQMLDEYLPVIPLYHFDYMYALNPKICYQREGVLRHTHLKQIQIAS